jgi:DNA (cytosine-5)-methyltransferase 1
VSAYYNEIDPFAAAWLRELIKAGLIAYGEVDERSIELVQPDDLRGFVQCHFFAGIGGWSYALRLAGWPDDRAVWSGSCPCQPFSSAGKGRGKDDARHLWPQFRRVIRQCRPAVVFGEQVASKAGRVWLSAVFADVEALAYRAAGADLCAAGVGTPHIRQRLYFVLADSASSRRKRKIGHSEGKARQDTRLLVSCAIGEAGDMGDADDARSQGRVERWDGTDQCAARPASVAGFWSECEWIACRDWKSRPVEPGTFPLAHGVPARVGRLRGYGNAIVPEAAAAFIEAYCDIEAESVGV